MRVPKSFDFIPMGDLGVSQAVNDALDEADDLRAMFRETTTRLRSETNEATRKLGKYRQQV